MKRLVTMVSMMIVLLFFVGNGIYAQGHVDPPYLLIQSAEHPITVDGKLDETDWQRRFDHLVYRANFKPGDVEYAVTGGELVKGDYPDTTSTIVKILHHGLDLYISLQSDDHSVCRFGDSWEGDGLFMKIKDAGGTDVEYKLYFNLAGADPDIHYEEPGLYPGSGSGAAYKHPGTIVNDTTQVDSGYTAELVIHLDQLGYTDPYAGIPVLINIFDPDGFHDGTPAWGEIGSFHKLWWGSQWGPDMRLLRLGDPPSKIAIKTDEAFVLDGQLNESFWANADSVIVAKGSNSSSAGYYMQWGDTLNSYTDQSAAVIKFVHKGTDLYVGVQSNDASVCKWSPGWEADGLFFWMTYKGQIPLPGERLEIKAMYFDATQGASISFETNANVPTGAAEAVSFEPTGTVTHTETNGADAGYSIELLIHTDMFGYSDLDTVKLGTVIWDLDYASADAYNPIVADYALNWWGTQWADPNFEKYYMYRDLILSDRITIGEPGISVDVASIDFGEVIVDDHKDTLVTITNTGNGVLTISSITSENPDFTVDKTSFTVQPGASANLEVTFKPTAIETYNGTLTISSNAGDVAISLTGKGKEGVIVEKPGHSDPPHLLIQSAEKEIVIDGKLDDTDWQRRFDHLVYRANFTPGDVEYAVTGGELVKGDYPDTTSTIVKVLHHGLDLYISLQSDDHSVCRFGDSWEGDGLFMKIKDAGGTDVEYKLYFNLAGADPDIHYEEPGLYPGSGSGAAYKFPATVVNDTTQVDSGYTAELVIHLDQLGYTDPYAGIPVLINIFDPDGFHDGTPAWGEIGSFHKLWWGSQWGPDMRILRLADPPSKNAIKTDTDITLDGQLNESFWANAEYVVIAKGSNLSSAGYYQQWGDPDNTIDDTSAAIVKFVHKGTDLYIGVQSDDKSVCKWSPGWEADGLFFWMTYKGQIPLPGERLEIKAMYFDATQGASISFETNANVPTGAAEGASYEPAGTVTHTETNGEDAGYSIEVVVHTDMFGYADGDTVKVSVCIWDLDFASVDAYDPKVADYAPHWWGTQWVDPNFEKYYMYRDVVLSDLAVAVRDEKPSTVVHDYQLEQNFPNPFNPTTTIQYNLPNAAKVTIEVFNILGNKVATLVNEKQLAGIHSVEWDGKDASGISVVSGVYFYKISTKDFSATKKMLLMK